MIIFLITCISFTLLYKSLAVKLVSPWASEMTHYLSLWFCKYSSFFRISEPKKVFPSPASSALIPPKMSMKEDTSGSATANVEMTEKLSLLDLPELVLECILEKLPPEGLCSMAGVCSSLRERCMSDHLWERHMKRKWGRIIGPAAYREWQWQIASRNNLDLLEVGKLRGFMRSLFHLWPLSLIRSTSDCSRRRKGSLPVESIMSWYLALETGKFWFPAQVYNRENGHIGFMLSCYDAELCYNPCTDTFQARYLPHGKRAVVIENGVTWERLRAPPVDMSPHDLHVCDCLDDLQPGDHVEIQWRRNKDFPYGWWYGVVGHLESCDGNRNYCRCHDSDTVVLEFNQYTPGSRWRHMNISRKDHREEGNEADGFYGGVRKLHTSDEISMWRRLWPAEVLE